MSRLLQADADGWAERTPEASAVVMGDATLTYADLAQASDRLAAVLREHGLEPGDRVCFMLPKSPLAIVVMLGVLKADGVYVPMDAASPAPRLARIIRAAEPRFLLAAGPVASQLLAVIDEVENDRRPRLGWLEPRSTSEDPDTAAAAALAEVTLAEVEAAVPLRMPSRRRTSDAAHLLFTSGSTGQPKGVVISHSNVTHFVDWAVRYFGMLPTDRVSGHSPLHFDLSTFDVFGAFAAGASLYPVPPELSLAAARLADFIRSTRLTQWFSVPSALTYMASFDVVREHDFPDLVRLMWCGEVFPTPPLRYWMRRLRHVSFTNLYGPTEATIASSYHTLTSEPDSDTAAIPIGQACAGEELLILDDQQRLVEVGEVGNLHIGGLGLSQGYWRDPEATAAAFGPHPLEPSKRVYRTGDLASRDKDGLVYFHGRADSQIKSRGYRIELGEIETALHALEGLRESAVVAIPTDRFEGYSICCAYVPGEGADISPASLRRALADSVPPYMLPGRWMDLDRLPKNANGKIDRPALRELFEAML